MTTMRVARPEDYDRIVGVVDDWWGWHIAPLLPRLFLDHFWQTSRVVEDAEGLAGFLIGFCSPSQPSIGYIHFVGVRPGLRRTGIAESLYAEFEQVARANGCTELAAITGPANTGSIAFHRRMGFEASAPIADYDGPGDDRVAFHRRLDATG